MNDANKIFQHWQNHPNLIRHHQLHPPAKRAIQARLKAGYSVEDLMRAISRYAELALRGRAPGWNNWGLEEVMSRGSGAWLDRLLDPGYRGITGNSVFENNRKAALEVIRGNENKVR